MVIYDRRTLLLTITQADSGVLCTATSIAVMDRKPTSSPFVGFKQVVICTWAMIGALMGR